MCVNVCLFCLIVIYEYIQRYLAQLLFGCTSNIRKDVFLRYTVTSEANLNIIDIGI